MKFENNLIIADLKSKKQEITVDYFFDTPKKKYLNFLQSLNTSLIFS